MNVYEATQKRIEYTFKNFDNIYVSFSGGKDSGLMLNLVIKYMRDNNITKKIGIFHMDYEAQYQMTTDYVDLMLSKNRDIVDVYRICLPLSAQCVTSMYQSYWTPWDREKKDLWVRELPKESINEENNPLDFFKEGMWDYEVQTKFSKWIHNLKKAKRTACLVGIRTQESMNRWRAIHSDRNYKNYNGINWTTEVYKDIYNVYPIYDWITEDIWTANYLYQFEYNNLYNLFYQAGVTIDQMRVASPFNDCAMDSLKLYRVIDPANWGRMVGRVNGVNFAGLYGGTTAMGWRNIKLPPNHTWKSYMEFLLNTLPEEAKDNYKKKLAISEKFWKNKGGCLSSSVVKKLKKKKVSFVKGKKTNYKTDKLPVKMDYLDDIDISEFKDIPTYKRMCVCIIKNDHLCKYMGFSLSKTETQLRKEAENKYKNTYK